MSQHRTLQDQQVAFQSGTSTLTGTVTRTSDTSIWVTFDADGRQYRFVEGQDGQWRRWGKAGDITAAALTFPNAPAQVTDAELAALLAPVGDVPTAVTRIEFSREQEVIADRIQRINGLVRNWADAEIDARTAIADLSRSLDSFRIDALINCAGQREPLRNMRVFLGKMQAHAVIGENGRVLELLNPAAAEELLGQFVEIAADAYEGWYRPNSTSNADVEIKLAQHEAWQSAYRVATGKRFY